MMPIRFVKMTHTQTDHSVYIEPRSVLSFFTGSKTGQSTTIVGSGGGIINVKESAEEVERILTNANDNNNE